MNLYINYNNSGFFLRTQEEKGIFYDAEISFNLTINSLTKRVSWYSQTTSPRSGLNNYTSFPEKGEVETAIVAFLKGKRSKLERVLKIINEEGFKKPEPFKNGIFLQKDGEKFYYNPEIFRIFH